MALQFCTVCGRGSTRASWPNSGFVNGTAYVACDFHSQVVIQIAVIDMIGPPTNAQVFPAQNGKHRKTIPEDGE